MQSPTEWEFTAEAAGWINEILARKPDLPFSAAKCEQRSAGSLTRRDLTLLDKDGKVVLTGEVKLPYRADGGSPYNVDVVRNARAKAARAGARFFFTWNVNECALWETMTRLTTLKDRNYRAWQVTDVQEESHLDLPMTVQAVKKWLEEFLNDFAQILLGTAFIGRKPPDEKFVEMVESALRMPVLLTMRELASRYQTMPFVRTHLDTWMRDEQGWTLYDDPEGLRDNMERAAKFTCYSLLTKLVFCEALRKHYARQMEKLSIPDHMDTGEELYRHLGGYFARTRITTGDYETVFGFESQHRSYGESLPFYSDAAVPHWRELVNQIHQFDFSKLDYEVIGSIFERLISPEERHKFGQFYTRSEVVDLMNSFCIQEGHEKVMDPACGGGTFLVRAYTRKRSMLQQETHKQALSELFGIDVSEFATRLTTINLASRELAEQENYPQIARSDFLDVQPQRRFLSLPRKTTATGLGPVQQRDVEIPLLDAVVGNPPYVRQEDIPSSTRRDNGPEHGTKEYYQYVTHQEAGTQLSGRSDIHCYFWPHAAAFLKERGYLCFLSSSQWLDVEYGFRLQEWMLRNFEIVAILESVDEPWFVGARVATAITILRRQQDEAERMDNIVRFVQLRRPIRELLSSDGTIGGAMTAVDAFRDEILSLKKSTANDRYRARLVRQEDLWQEGVRLGAMMAKAGKEEVEGGEENKEKGYYGGKWGVYLRAPDLWFKLIDRYAERWVPLAELVRVRRGVTSGNDDFFFPEDYSQQGLSEYPQPEAFRQQFEVARKDVEKGKIKLVKCGPRIGDIRPVEARYLEPEVHSIMDVDGYSVSASNCPRLALLVSQPPRKLMRQHVLEYIRWGEENGYDTGSTCLARSSQKRQWYDLTGHGRAPILWPKERQYRHLAPVNPEGLLANCRLYEMYPADSPSDISLWAGILNSSWGLLSSLQFGRPMGTEGNWSTMVLDMNMMLIPDPTGAPQNTRERVAQAFDRLKQRYAFSFLSLRRLRAMAYFQAGKEDELNDLSDQSELDMADRRELDDAVLEMIGVASRDVRDKLLDGLYSYLREFFEQTRQKEEKAILNKKKAKRRGPAKAAEIAQQIYDQIREEEPALLQTYDPGFIGVHTGKDYDTYEFPPDGQATTDEGLFNAHGVAFVKGGKTLAVIDTKNKAQDALVILVANSGVRGFVRIPHDESQCRKVLAQFETFLAHRSQRVRELIESRTADADLQEKILQALNLMLAHPAAESRRDD